MDDLVLRLLVVAALVLVAGAAALSVRSGVAVRRSSLSPVGLTQGIHLFSAASCGSCDRARAALLATGRPFDEHTYETSSDVHVNNRIDRVPAIAWVPAEESGLAAWIVMGVPSSRSLDRWFGP